MRGLFLAGLSSSVLLASSSLLYAKDGDRHAYHQSVASGYDYRFGAEMPFLPSNAVTDTGEFIPPQAFPSAKYCSHCHKEAHDQWRQSAHSNSFRAPWYVRNVNLLRDEKGIEYTRHCEGCHNPIALVSGALTKNAKMDRGFDEDGVTCTVCHSMQKTDTRGTGSYVIGQPAALLDEQGRPIYGEPADKEILANLDRHSAAVMKPFYRTSEFCAPCHKAALPRSLNNYKWQRAIFLYDEWQISSYAKQSPLPFYVKDSVSTCQTCHMPRVGVTTIDYGSKGGKLASHRWLGANTMLPTYYNNKEQLEKTTAFLKANNFNVDLFAFETGDGAPIIPIGTAPILIPAGKIVTLNVVIQNKGIGHTHVPEQRDIYESWVEFDVSDAKGKTIYHSGSINAKTGALDREAHSFTNRLINQKSALNDLHQVWSNYIVAYNNTIGPGRSQLVRYQFRIPPGTKGPVTISARVNYRRFNQHFIDFGMDKKHVEEPVVEMTTRTRTFNLGLNSPETSPEDNPLWQRWNNYGISLLDAQQYAQSVSAFEHVIKLRPTYADAYTNLGLAYFQWQRYDDSRGALERALTYAPDNARALYYLALVKRNQGDVPGAIADLTSVSSQFPRSRDAHRELGYSYYQLHQYEQARSEYETVQSIDPDDLSAHYNLAILYRRLGEKDKAAREAAAFSDQKDDPAANTQALDYLRSHPELAAESVAWHTHAAASTTKSVSSKNLANFVNPDNH